MNKFFNFFGLPGSLVLTSIISLYSMLLAFIDPTLTRLTCVVAMLLCSLGDILLMDYKPITRHFPKRGFIPGAITFAVGHVVYTCAFIWLIAEGKYPYFNAGAFTGIALFAVLAVLISVICLFRNANRKLLPLGILYLFFISLNCTTVFSAAASCRNICLISALGVFMFLLSDLIIALDKICGIKIKHSDTLIWTLYPLGQILLLIGA